VLVVTRANFSVGPNLTGPYRRSRIAEAVLNYTIAEVGRSSSFIEELQ